VNKLRAAGFEPQLLSTVRPKPTEEEAQAYARSPRVVRPPPLVVEPKPQRDPPGLKRALALLDDDADIVE